MAGGAVAYVYFTPKNVNCATGGPESDDPDADPGALQKARGHLQAIAEQNAFAPELYKAGRHAAQPWHHRPELHALMGDRGAVLSNWLVRGFFFWGHSRSTRGVSRTPPIPCSKEGHGGNFDPIGTFLTKAARFAHTLSGGFYLYRFR